MLSEDELLLAWCAYATGAAMIMLVGWRWLAWIPWPFCRRVVQGLLAVVLWVPVQAGLPGGAWAPGIVVLGFGIVTHQSALPLVGPWYVLGGAAVVAFSALVSLGGWLRRRLSK